MAKGFSTPDLRITKFVNRLVKALRSRNEERLEAAMTWGARNLGQSALSEVCQQIHCESPLPGMTDQDAEFYWDWMMTQLKASPFWDEAKSKAMGFLVETLTEQGYLLGKDFSFGPKGELIMSDGVSDSLLEMIPESERDYFRRHHLNKQSNQVDLRAIATNVGVSPDYFDQILAIGKKRLAPYVMRDDGDFVVKYAANLIEGTTTKFPELNDTNLTQYFLTKLASPQTMKRIFANAENYPADESGKALSCLWQDIVKATGIAQGDEFAVIEGELVVSYSGVKLIGTVWESDRFPLRELLTTLQKHSRK